jgi:hypothetical protein
VRRQPGTVAECRTLRLPLLLLLPVVPGALAGGPCQVVMMLLMVSGPKRDKAWRCGLRLPRLPARGRAMRRSSRASPRHAGAERTSRLAPSAGSRAWCALWQLRLRLLLLSRRLL